MERDYKIDIKFKNEGYSNIELIRTLLKAGWRIFNNKEITYLPLGNCDIKNLECNPITIEDIYSIIDEKEKSKEVVSVVLYWKSTNIGVVIGYEDINNITIDLKINRKEIKGLNGITNVNWYLERIINPLLEKEFIIDGYSYNEL